MENSLLSCAVIAWLTAQITKVIIDAVLSKRLKIERVGHTPLQVVIGAALGIVVGLIY